MHTCVSRVHSQVDHHHTQQHLRIVRAIVPRFVQLMKQGTQARNEILFDALLECQQAVESEVPALNCAECGS